MLGLRLWVYGVFLGVRIALRGRLRDGIKLIIYPLGYWRFWPNAVLLWHLKQAGPASSILDVGSPKLPSVFFAESTRAQVTAVDLDDAKLFSRWLPAAQRLGLTNYKAEFQDARHLNYPDAAFDYVFSISVIEHIPESGDSKALQEFCRVLKPGGVAVVEVPFRRKHEDIFKSYDSKGAPLEQQRFYERYYDLHTLGARLTVPGLILLYTRILGERLPVDPWIAAPRLPRPFRVAILPLEPLLAIFNIWIRQHDASGRPLGALLVYRKPDHSS